MNKSPLYFNAKKEKMHKKSLFVLDNSSKLLYYICIDIERIVILTIKEDRKHKNSQLIYSNCIYIEIGGIRKHGQIL